MTTSDTYALYLPSAFVGDATFTLDATLKYPDSTFPIVDHVFYAATQVTVGANGDATAGATLAISSPTGNINPSTTENYQFTFDSGSDAANDEEGLQVNIPATQVSFDVTSTTISGSFTAIIPLLSDDSSFAANSILATENTNTVLADSTNTAITVTDITSGSDESKDATFYMAAITLGTDGIPTDAVCAGSATASTTVVAPTFAAPSATASSCTLRGPTNYDATLTITATVDVFVPQSSTITIGIAGFE